MSKERDPRAKERLQPSEEYKRQCKACEIPLEQALQYKLTLAYLYEYYDEDDDRAGEAATYYDYESETIEN